MRDRMDHRQGTTLAVWRAPIGLTVAVLTLIFGPLGCASSRVSNLETFEKIPMQKVSPYPTAEEMRNRGFEIVVVDRPAMGIDDAQLEKPRAQVRRSLEAIAAESGAAVIDRSLQQIRGIRTEGLLGEEAGRESEAVSGADYALATRFSDYRYTAQWKPPFKFLWQSAEDVSGKQGTCTHSAQVDLDIQIVKIGQNDVVAKTYALKHAAIDKYKDTDSSCSLAPVAKSVLFERALDEALSCLELPLGARLSPRGHIVEHRKAPGTERHIYRTTLGSVHGVEMGDSVEIRREQRSTSPGGEQTRTERVIGVGEVTDQVTPNASWIAADPVEIQDEILDGDLIRPLLSEGLLSSLSGPDCETILIER